VRLEKGMKCSGPENHRVTKCTEKILERGSDLKGSFGEAPSRETMSRTGGLTRQSEGGSKKQRITRAKKGGEKRRVAAKNIRRKKKKYKGGKKRKEKSKQLEVQFDNKT